MTWFKRLRLITLFTVFYCLARLLSDMRWDFAQLSRLREFYGDQWPARPLRYLVTGAITGLLVLTFMRWMASRSSANQSGTGKLGNG